MNRIIPGRAGLLGPGPDDQTILVPLTEATHYHTDGTTGSTYIDLTNDTAAGLGGYVASVQAYTAMEAKSANFKFRVVFQGSVTGRTFGSVTPLFTTYVTANGEAAQTAYTSVDNLGLVTRWALECLPATGTAVESGLLWIYLAFRLRR
jgi:hypothetical protein